MPKPVEVCHTAERSSDAELLQLIAARLERRPIVVMPYKCKTLEEWLRRYGDLKGIRDVTNPE